MLLSFNERCFPPRYLRLPKQAIAIQRWKSKNSSKPSKQPQPSIEERMGILLVIFGWNFLRFSFFERAFLWRPKPFCRFPKQKNLRRVDEGVPQRKTPPKKNLFEIFPGESLYGFLQVRWSESESFLIFQNSTFNADRALNFSSHNLVSFSLLIANLLSGSKLDL